MPIFILFNLSSINREGSVGRVGLIAVGQILSLGVYRCIVRITLDPGTSLGVGQDLRSLVIPEIYRFS